MTDNQEHIGKILLDYKYYPGEDLYCDGQIEEELLEIARDRAQVEYPSIIEERKNWPILYHLSASGRILWTGFPSKAQKRCWKSVPAVEQSPAFWRRRLVL